MSSRSSTKGNKHSLQRGARADPEPHLCSRERADGVEYSPAAATTATRVYLLVSVEAFRATWDTLGVMLAR